MTRKSTLIGRDAADAGQFLGLQHAQQVDLHLGADGADLVEEQRAAVGHLDLALAPVLGAGEGALSRGRTARSPAGSPGSAPQLTATIGKVAPLAVGVDGAGDELLAGAALAADRAPWRRSWPRARPVP